MANKNLFLRIIEGIDKALDRIDQALVVLSVFVLLGITFFILSEVFFRKVFSYSIPAMIGITEDYLMVGLIFFSMSYVYKEDGHVRVTLFDRFIPKAIKRPASIVVTLLGFVYFLLILIYNWESTARSLRLDERSSDVVGYPLAVGYAFVVWGSAMMCVSIAKSLFRPYNKSNTENNNKVLEI